MKAVTHIVDLAKHVDNVVSFGPLGDSTTTSRCKAAEQPLNENPNM